MVMLLQNTAVSASMKEGLAGHSQSLDIPTMRHFLKRHCWQRFLLILMMGQLSFLRHFLYWMFCWILLLKKPWRWTRKHPRV